MIIAGCVAQAENEEMVKREPYIDIILGPQSYHKVNDVLKKHIINLKQEETEFDTISKFGYFDLIKNEDTKISSFLLNAFKRRCSFFFNSFSRFAFASASFKRKFSIVH